VDLAKICQKKGYNINIMLDREVSDFIDSLKNQFPVIAITGPRQSGKTVLAKSKFPNKPYINLEDLEIREAAREDPKRFLKEFPNGAVIDEAQHVPELFSYIQVIVDEKKQYPMFILTGSQQFLLMKNISQSLSGRVALINLLPLSLNEFKNNKNKKVMKNFIKTFQNNYDEIIYHGFYPGIFDRNINPNQFYKNYVKTYIERDLGDLSNVHDIALFRKFMQLCAGRIGQILNHDSLANDLGISASTIRSWLSILETSYIIFKLESYHSNLGKRLIKSAKLYFYDTGLASYLLGIESHSQIKTHPLRGSLFENLAVGEILKFRYNQGKNNNLNFYRDRSKEIDIIYRVAQNILPIEIKSAETINNKLFESLIYIENLVKDLPYGKLLIYGGESKQSRKNAEVINPWDINSYLAKI
jgi:hypothetical protein